ncbi:MAG: RNA degradosome polyphosphate kinase, partial [Geodermatophilaceae bacterium]|nr:RNA degradosome polyphosphate kinase [Geodermatophilaceae bacterium]
MPEPAAVVSATRSAGPSEPDAADGAADSRTRPSHAAAGALPPGRYLNRELSWLDFNGRVLSLAVDSTLPLLERMKFLAIFASNLDEFYMVRVAGLKRRQSTGLSLRSL